MEKNLRKTFLTVCLLRTATLLVLIYPISLFSVMSAGVFIITLLNLATGQDVISSSLASLGMTGVALFGSYALVMTLFFKRTLLVLLGLMFGLILYTYFAVITLPQRPIGIVRELVLGMPVVVTLTHIYLIISHRLGHMHNKVTNNAPTAPDAAKPRRL